MSFKTQQQIAFTKNMILRLKEIEIIVQQIKHEVVKNERISSDSQLDPEHTPNQAFL